MQKYKQIIEIVPDKCSNCLTCIRDCPVRAIIIKDNQQYPEVLVNRCIGCGTCITSCNSGAIRYIGSKEEIKKILKEEDIVVAISDTTISSEFPDITDYRKYVGMLRSLGFRYVFDSAFPVDLVAQKYLELWGEFKGKNYISANCPAIVNYIEKYQTEMIENLAPIVSPYIAAARMVHKILGNNIKVVYIGPCIAISNEILKYDNESKIDFILTFKELRELFTEFNISESILEYSDFDGYAGYKGYLYPISNGIIQAANLSEDLLKGDIITVEGKDKSISAINEFKDNIENINSHLNIFYDQGCLNGPGCSKHDDLNLKQSLVKKYASKHFRLLDMKLWEKGIKEFSDLDLTPVFIADDQRLPDPPEEKVQGILKLLTKDDPKNESNCKSCGFDSCRDLAIAVAQGLSKTDMCISFVLRNRNEFIKTLKAANEKLTIMQKSLEESEAQNRKEKEKALEAHDIINSMVQKLRAGIIIMDKNMKVILSNQALVEMLGDEVKAIDEVIPGLVGADVKSLLPYQIYNLFSYVMQSGENILSRDVNFNEKLLNISVYSIRKGKITGAIIRDMLLPEVQKEEIINRVTEVIDKNLEMVQKIGFLLGESAAETEKMLNSIIEFQKTGKKLKS
jgi:Na+-translocating ferredoxin:NAD+ oxidoreductase RNF subunit RnfB